MENFSSLYIQYYRKAFLFVKSYVHDEMIVEDIVSDVFVKVWQMLKNNEVKSFEAILLTMLKNSALDYLKHQRIKFKVEDIMANDLRHELDFRISTLEACDPEEIFYVDVKDIIVRTLQSQPARSRKIFELSRYEEKSNQEIADEMNISVKGVEYHITKVIKLLRINLKDYLCIIYCIIFKILS